MTLLAKKNRTELPSLVNDFFNVDRFISPFDFDNGLLDFNGGSLVVPSANIIENEDNFKVELAVPGFEKDDFKVEIQNDMLVISAEKEEEEKEEKNNFRRREFFYNSFKRSFTLPENCLSDKIDAKYENGILKLRLPKKEVMISKPKKEIKVS